MAEQTTYGRKNLFWKGRYLYFKSTVLKADPKIIMAVKPLERFPSMFYVEWPDGILSADFYNSTRAKDHAERIALKTLNNPTEDQSYDV